MNGKKKQNMKRKARRDHFQVNAKLRYLVIT